MKKKVLFLGASGLIGPYLTPGLSEVYDLYPADIKPHPDGGEMPCVDVSSYEQVYEAARGMDAIANYTVVRGDPVLSFHVNTRGAWHVMKAAAAHGISHVIQTGPQEVRRAYEHDFDLVDVPPMADSGYYGCTKRLGAEISRIFAQAYAINTSYFVFAGLGPSPEEPISGEDFHVFRVYYEDLVHACCLALEVEVIPGYYQEFNMHSFRGHEKYRLDKAREILGFEPTRQWEELYKRLPQV